MKWKLKWRIKSKTRNLRKYQKVIHVLPPNLKRKILSSVPVIVELSKSNIMCVHYYTFYVQFEIIQVILLIHKDNHMQLLHVFTVRFWMVNIIVLSPYSVRFFIFRLAKLTNIQNINMDYNILICDCPRYKNAFARLRSLKTEIEHLQHLLERSKVKLMKDFEIWWAEQGAVNQDQQAPPPVGHAKNAWRTPPMSPSGRAPQSLYQDSSQVWEISVC